MMKRFSFGFRAVFALIAVCLLFLSPFAASAGGLRGMTAMELDRDGLHAFKSWLFTEDFVVCLGTGLRSDSSLRVSTTVNQCLRNDCKAQVIAVDGADECWMALYEPGCAVGEAPGAGLTVPGVYHLEKTGNGWTVLKSNPFRLT